MFFDNLIKNAFLIQRHVHLNTCLGDNEEDGYRKFGGRHPVIFYRVPEGKYAGNRKTNSSG
jgi:hypothetical protein